jgi:NTP pyrophosphatase (non-canonical NTP hydrolase)
MKRFTAEAFAAMSRRRGYTVQRPAKDEIEARLRETIERLRAGEPLAELSRRDEAALIGAAMERPLTEDEALRALAGHQYLEHCLGSAEDQLASERSWCQQQVANADAWKRAVSELGRAITQIARAIGDDELAQDPDRLASVAVDLLSGFMPADAVILHEARLARALGRVAEERRRQREKWGETWAGATARPLTDPKHQLAVLMEEVGEVARAILDKEGDEHLLEELAQVAAVVVVWIELLLPNHEVAQPTGQGSAGCTPSEHAAAGGEAVQSMARNTEGHAPARTGLPRDATTAALNAASEELREYRIAVRLIAGAIADPPLAEEPRLLADRVTETIDALKTGLEAGEADHNKTLELLGRQTRALAKRGDEVEELMRALEQECTWGPLDIRRPLRGWAVVAGEDSVGTWALFDSEAEARAFADWRRAVERAKSEDDRDPNWDYVNVLPAELDEGLPARFWNSLDPAPGPDAAEDAGEVQP